LVFPESSGFNAEVPEDTYFQGRSRSLQTMGSLLQNHELKLNLRCGPNRKPGWINIDLFDCYADLRLDLREKCP
jgi:hypothetical protein